MGTASVGKKATGIASFLTVPVLEAGKAYPPDELAHLPPDEPDAASLQPIKRVRIVRRADGYFCQFCVATDWQVTHQPTGVDRGIDVGLNAYYTDSEGHKVANPRFFSKAEQKVRHLQRSVSRKSHRQKNRRRPHGNHQARKRQKRSRYPKQLVAIGPGIPPVKDAKRPPSHNYQKASSS